MTEQASEPVRIDDRQAPDIRQFVMACEALSGFINMCVPSGKPSRESIRKRVQLHSKVFDLCMEQVDFEIEHPGEGQS